MLTHNNCLKSSFVLNNAKLLISNTLMQNVARENKSFTRGIFYNQLSLGDY